MHRTILEIPRQHRYASPSRQTAYSRVLCRAAHSTQDTEAMDSRRHEAVEMFLPNTSTV